MKMRTRFLAALAVAFAIGAMAGCATPAPTPTDTGNPQLPNPWIDATAAQAAEVLGGTMYSFTTLDSAYKQYALLVTTDDAVQKTGVKPTAWVRFQKGDEDVSLQIFKGGKLDAEQLKGTPADLKGAMAYISQNEDGTSNIAWEANGLLYEISTSIPWSSGDLIALAQGVKAAS